MAALKRILFLNRSFYPDVESTGQLLTELCEELENDFEIHVICGNPLYRKAKNRGIINKSLYRNITIWRINNTRFPKKYLFARIINLISYFVPCFIRIFFFKNIACVIAETDPPLLGIIACLYSKIRNSCFIYYVQDLWPNVGIVNGQLTNRLIIKILKRTNQFLYDNSNKIIVPGRNMKVRLVEENDIPPYKIEVVENWADPNQIFPIKRKDNIFLKQSFFKNKFVVMYSGNIGLSQDLENIIYLADSLKEIDDILFVLIGEGAYKDKLINLSASRGLKNIKFLTYQDKENLKFTLSAAHVHLIPMKKGMRGYIVPSKVYGIMAAGKPFIAAVDEESEIYKMTYKFKCGINVKPSNVEELKKGVLWAYKNKQEIEKMEKKGRRALEKFYSKKICTQKFKKVIEDTI